MSNREKLFKSNLPSRAVNVALYLDSMANSERKCWPSIRKIATDLHISHSTVKRAIIDLKTNGFLETETRRRPSGAYSSLLYELLF